jgi:hypothetical protein
MLLVLEPRLVGTTVAGLSGILTAIRVTWTRLGGNSPAG